MLWIVFFIVALLALSKLTEYILLGYYEKHWEEVADTRSAEYLAAAEQGFSGVQRLTRRVATEVAQSPPVVQYLSGRRLDRRVLFEHVSAVSQEKDVGIEVYDAAGALVAWAGPSGPSHTQEIHRALKGQLTSYVTRSSVYSQLFVATPVRFEGSILGAILVRRTIEVHYPLNNKFINREGLADRLSQSIAATVELNFSPLAELRKDGRYVSAVLYGIDSSRVGVVSVLRPARSAYLEGIKTNFQWSNAILVAILLIILVVFAGHSLSRVDSIMKRSAGMTLVIWSARYVLLWLDIPSIFFTQGIFDPTFFASKFGGGIAKSIGELTLTTCALLVNVVYLARLALHKAVRGSPWWYPGQTLVRWPLAIVTTTMIFLLLRGYGATIQSAVFDSTLNFSDQRVIVPSYQQGVIVFDLFAISFCLIVVVVGLTSFLLMAFSRGTSRPGSGFRPWFIVAGLYALAAVLFGILQENPLMSTPYRLMFAAGVIALTYYLHSSARRGRSLATVGNFLIGLGFSAICYYPLIDEKIHEKETDLVQVFANDVLRPVDSWLKFVVREALQSFETEETREVLQNGPPEDVERLAFTRWAQSSVNREGYSCFFAVTDPQGRTLSQFTIGGQGFLAAQVGERLATDTARSVQVTKVGTGVSAINAYTGTVPLGGAGKELLGAAIVVVSAAQQPFFRGASPPILRSTSQQGLESFYRRITVSEFQNGTLVSSNNATLPLTYRLPEGVRAAFADSLRTSCWWNEEIEGREYETLFVRRSAGSSDVVAISLQRLGVAWHLLNAVKTVVYYSVIALVALVMLFLFQWLRGKRYTLTFRDRLLAALLVTAAIPLILMASYVRIYAGGRLMDEVSNRLEEETETIAVNITEADTTGRAEEVEITPIMAEQLAADVGTDFNLYRDHELQISSRPELFQAGILDRRLSGNAYANVMIGGKPFHVETEHIGLYQYAVGYRPLVNALGQIIGVVSVPTVYRQDEVDEEVSKQNAFIFGMYALLLMAIIMIAATFANRIAAPIHQLTEATKRVAQGEFDVHVQRADGEVGELVEAFETMTQDLKRNRENLIRYERELAWKEMAKQVAHEIKNPLTPMKLSLQHLRQTYRDKAPDFDTILERVSTTIIDQIDTLSRIASEFSHFGRMPRPKLESCDVNTILTESIELFRQEEKVQFEVSLGSDLPEVSADREELRRAFINVIRNGIQALNNAGTIVVTSAKALQEVVITIKDSGPGIPAEIRDKLFQPNISTKRDGMGLGLAIVKKTLDDLGGNIVIESPPAGGTQVTIRLPISR